MAAVVALFLLDPVIRHFRYPVGWDAPYYVWRASAVPVDGLTRLGAVRAGSPLLFALLMRATGQNAFTIASVVPPILAGVVGLGASATVRAGLRIRPIWIPVIGVLAWVGFGRVGIMNGHFDQLLNAALVLGAFAAAIAFAGTGRGAGAVAILLAGAGLAEWPFWAFAVAILLLALGLVGRPAVRTRVAGRPERNVPAGPLLWAVGASAAFTALLFLVHPPGGRIGPSLNRPSLRRLLRARFLDRVRDPLRYLAFPLALGGGLVAATPRPGATAGTRQEESAEGAARSLFLCLMASWVAATVVAGVAQAAGIPVAGARLTSYLFAVPILAGVFVWWVARRLEARLPGAPGRVAAVAVVLLVVGGFGAVAWQTGRDRIPYFEPEGVREVAAAGAYVARFAPEARVDYLVANPHGDGATGGRWWHETRAVLPPAQVVTADRFTGPPDEFLSTTPGDTIGIVLRRYNRAGYGRALADGSGVLVAPGVVALRGPDPGGPIASVPPPQSDLRLRNLVWLLPSLAALLFVAGSGWAIALLPMDTVTRIAVAPALGTAVLSIAALAWERLGFGFASWEALLIVALSAAAGWAAVPLSRVRRPGPPRP
jgi:hypothetical protein